MNSRTCIRPIAIRPVQIGVPIPISMTMSQTIVTTTTFPASRFKPHQRKRVPTKVGSILPRIDEAVPPQQTMVNAIPVKETPPRRFLKMYNGELHTVYFVLVKGADGITIRQPKYIPVELYNAAAILMSLKHARK